MATKISNGGILAPSSNTPSSEDVELREDGTEELREDGTTEIRE